MNPILTPKQRQQEANRRYRANMSPEKRAQRREAHRLRENKRRSKLSPDEKELVRSKDRLRRSTPDQRLLRRDYMLKYKFNLSLEDWEEMFNAQGRRCGICEAVNKRWVVDHCHSSGKIRGILCSSCNKALGLIKDNTATLASALTYLLR